ncbi:AAA family ATPase [Streptomyces boncukensis]|uniref:ATP-binding protein n=1 Tax=Streptomyces boncukensis TaxID=2711219 RepID=A0A6G4WW25_9ACTN|nr:ATP-binding protein [Streptomyces boncukensis]NGO69486.1 ATP-binding protein [Streptomyces boncukensis]
MDTTRPRAATVSELRVSAFRALRARTVPLGRVTVLTGPSGSGKTTALEAYQALARLGGGEPLGAVFGGARGGPAACVPREARPDRQGRRGFRLGCSVTGPVGEARVDVAVQAEPELRIVGERLATREYGTLLSTALRDPGRRTVQAEWHTAGAGRVTRAPFPDDRLGTALVPLRVAGTTPEQRRVLAAAEQIVVALRSAFPCDPRPDAMRSPVPPGDGLLRGGCDNLAAVLRRTRAECATRHAALLSELRAGCAGPVTELRAEGCGDGLLRAVLDRGDRLAATPLDRLGDGELRFTALALVLLTGPGVLSVDPAREVPAARQALAVLADGVDRGLDTRQARQLLALAARMGSRGHIRLLATAADAGPVTREAARMPDVTLVDLSA